MVVMIFKLLLKTGSSWEVGPSVLKLGIPPVNQDKLATLLLQVIATANAHGAPPRVSTAKLQNSCPILFAHKLLLHPIKLKQVVS